MTLEVLLAAGALVAQLTGISPWSFSTSVTPHRQLEEWEALNPRKNEQGSHGQNLWTGKYVGAILRGNHSRRVATVVTLAAAAVLSFAATIAG